MMVTLLTHNASLGLSELITPAPNPSLNELFHNDNVLWYGTTNYPILQCENIMIVSRIAEIISIMSAMVGKLGL